MVKIIFAFAIMLTYPVHTHVTVEILINKFFNSETRHPKCAEYILRTACVVSTGNFKYYKTSNSMSNFIKYRTIYV